VVVLPKDSFLLTEDVEDALGLSPESVLVTPSRADGKWLWVDKQLNKQPQRAIVHPWVRGRPLDEMLRHTMNDDHRLLMAPHPLNHSINYSNRTRFSTLAQLADGEQTLWNQVLESADTRRYPRLRDGSSILRTYETDIELRSADHGGWGVMQQYATRQTRPKEPHLPRARFLLERLSNVIHIPELCLVVAGSMHGRVALITPTSPKSDALGMKRGFRIEAILPTIEDEEKSLRPMCALYGIAASPVPVAGGGFKQHRPALAEPRYRLMIHFYDLTILSYELSRTADNDLMVC
jgi:hypothetical protein